MDCWQSPKSQAHVIQLEDGRIIRRHVDYVKKRDISVADPELCTDLTPEPPNTVFADPPQDTDSNAADLSTNDHEHADPLANEPESETVDSTQPRRSARVCKPLNYFSK